MRKVIKILAMVLSTIILLLIFLPILSTLVLNVDAVQNFVVDKATHYVSRKLGTRVSIDRIDMDLFSRVRVEGFYVEDYERDTLIYVGQAKTSIASLNIKEDGLHLRDVEAKNAKFYLRELPSGELNITPIIRALQTSDSESDFRLYMDDLDVENLDFRYQRLETSSPEYGVDYADIFIRDVDAEIDDFSVVKGAVRGDIKHLSGVEQSGAVISKLSGEMLVDAGKIHFDELRLQTPNSSIYMPRMHINGEGWLQYKNYIEEVDMDFVVADTRLSTNDIGFFAPALREWGIVVRDVDAEFKGTVSDFDLALRDIAIGGASKLDATARITGMPDWRAAKYVIGVDNMHLVTKDVEKILNSVLKDSLPREVTEIIERVEWVDMRATFGGRWDSFRFAGNINSATGGVRADATLARVGNHRYSIDGLVKTMELDVGRVLNKPKVGCLDADADIAATFGSKGTGGLVGDVDLSIESIDYNGYKYQDIDGRGMVDGDKFYGEVNSTDPNLVFDMFADVDLNKDNPYYKVSMELAHADLHALGINKRDEISELSANIGIDISGASLEQMNGYVSIADAEYHYPGGDIYSNRLRLDMDSTPEQKFVKFDSEFFNLEYRSRSSYRDVYNYLYNSLQTYVPLLYNSDGEVVSEKKSVNSASDYTVFSIVAQDNINELLDALAGGLVVAPETMVSMTFNPRSNNLIVRGRSEALEYGGVIMANVELDLNNSSRDSLAVRMKSDGVYQGYRLLMPNFNLNGGARENRITLTAGFKDGESRRSAMLGLSAKFSRNAETNRRSIHVDVSPSHFTTDSLQWKLYARGIDIDSSRIDVNDLRVTLGNQLLKIDGVASRERTDSILLTLDRFDISPLSELTSRIGYRVEGLTTGYACVKSALDNPEINALIDVDSLKVNGLAAPPQQISSDWDFKENRARVFITDRNTKHVNIKGYYQPVGNRYYASARMRHLNAKLIEPFLVGIVSDFEGDVNVYADIQGEGRMAKVNGRATADNLGATIDYTQVRYTAPYGELSVKDNVLRMDGMRLYDKFGNSGVYKMMLDLNHLSNVVYDISIEADKTLVLDTKAKDNDLFYGHVFATGTGSFRGDKRGVKMEIEATSNDNSHFYMPLMGKEDVSYADFVRFRTAEPQKVDTSEFLVRRMMAYERKARPTNTIGSVMDIDMTLNVLPNVDMQLVIDPTLGDIIQGRGTGQFAMHFVPESNIYEMRGEYTISEGNYLFTLQNIWHKKFKVLPGSSVSWNGDPMAAKLNIDAVYDVKTSLKPLIGNSMQGIDTSRAVPVECYIKLTDDMMAPKVEFDVKVPNVAPEIQTVIDKALNDQESKATQMFWLLATNSFSSEDTGAVGASFSATTGFEMLSNQLSNWLSGENYNVILRYRPRTEQTGDEVDFGFSKSLLNNRLLVEVEGGYLSDEALQAAEKASNFVGEAFITWLIDPDGAFRLRGFTQTIDRYGENQGMQESGIGVYYSESFNSFKDLGESLKNRFKRDSVARAEHRLQRDSVRAERKQRKVEK